MTWPSFWHGLCTITSVRLDSFKTSFLTFDLESHGVRVAERLVDGNCRRRLDQSQTSADAGNNGTS